MEDKKYSELGEKILKGIQLAVNRLIQNARPDDEFVFWENGKIVHKKAKDIKLN